MQRPSPPTPPAEGAGQRRPMATHTDKYAAVVVGAGPGGITCLGNLLERKLSPILWVDDSFNGGRINRLYREVPSNTKVKLFIDFGTGTVPFRKIVSNAPSRDRWEEPSESDSLSGGKPDKLQHMRELEQMKGCQLSHAADMCLTLTEGLKRYPGVETQQARVSEAVFNGDSSSARWTVKFEDESTFVQTDRVVLCTGASPNNNPLPIHIPNIQVMDLDTALSPTRMGAALASSGPTTIAVIGASHSAILVLMNLYYLASTSKSDLRIRWLTRHPLRYAQEMDGWILRDNTGLKQEAARWAKANLEPEVFHKSDVSNYMERIDYEPGDEEGTFEEHLIGCQYYVQAIGYNRDPIPTLKSSAGKEITPQFDNLKGSFNYLTESTGDLAKLPGLYGAGIAFPERVTDPHGNVEYAVGFFKFMKFVKKVVHEWN